MQTENTTQNGKTDSQIVENADLPESMSTPGGVLKAERLRQNLSEKEVSEFLHLTLHYVRAIESNRFDKLPGAVFAKGYIKSYALMLGLDATAVAALFEGINTEQQEMKDEATQRHLARRRRDRNKPWVYASGFSFVLGFAVLWAYNLYSTNQDAPSQVAAPVSTPAQESTASSSIVENTAPGVAVGSAPASSLATQSSTSGIPPLLAQQTTPEAILQEAASTSGQSAGNPSLPNGQAGNSQDLAATASVLPGNAVVASANGNDNIIFVGSEGDDLLRINFTGESWVEVNDSQSRQLYRDILEAGDVLEITGDAPFSILLGNAPFTRMFLNGNEINVSENIRIDNSASLTVGL